MSGNWISPCQLLRSLVYSESFEGNAELGASPSGNVNISITPAFNEKPDSSDPRMIVCECFLSVSYAFLANGSDETICKGACDIAGSVSARSEVPVVELEGPAQEMFVKSLRANTLSLLYAQIRGRVDQTTGASVVGRRILPAISPFEFMDAYMEKMAQMADEE